MTDQLPAPIPSGALTTPTDTYIVPALIADVGDIHPDCRGAGVLFAERRRRGYTLYDAQSGALVARLRPTGREVAGEIRTGR